jgi:hypothetical protein
MGRQRRQLEAVRKRGRGGGRLLALIGQSEVLRVRLF